MKKVFILDTNVLLHSARALEAFEDNILVVPMPVIEELDKFKKYQDELGRNARKCVRKIDSLRESSARTGGPKLYSGIPLGNGTEKKESGILRVVLDVSSEEKKLLPDTGDFAYADNRILAIACKLKKEYENTGEQVTVVSKDLNLRLRADALGLAVEDFKNEKVSYDELYTGNTEAVISVSDMDDLFAGKTIAPLPGIPLYPNEFLLLKEEVGSRARLGVFRNGRIAPLPPLPGDKVWNIHPRSQEQRMALSLLTDPEIQVVTLVGKAGSGKTFLALAGALECVKKLKLQDKILVSRPIVPMGKDIGYLPGDKDEKLNVWMQPIFDNLSLLLREDGVKGGGSENFTNKKVDELRKTGVLELEALTYIRGRSIPNQYIIVDEAQNLTPHEVKTIISRAGENTKIVLTGDPDQIDNPYLDASSNGLSYAAEHLKGLALHGHITLKKSERSPLAAAAAKYL